MPKRFNKVHRNMMFMGKAKIVCSLDLKVEYRETVIIRHAKTALPVQDPNLKRGQGIE